MSVTSDDSNQNQRSRPISNGMRILIYAPIFPPMVGGPATQGFHLCRVLLKQGNTPIVVTVGERFEVASPDGYLVYRYPWRITYTPLDKIIRWIVFPFYFSKILTKEKPDVVHANNVSALSFVAGWLARRKNIPTVIKYGGEWVWETLSSFGLRTANLNALHKESPLARFLWRIEKRGLSYFDRIWVPSEYRAVGVENILGHRRNVHIIPNSMDLPPGGFHELGKDDPFIIVTASRIVPHKRIPLILKAFKTLGDLKAKLVVIGIGEELEKAKAEAKTLGIESQVTFTGRLFGKAIYDEFSKASVYVSASLEEGFPNVFVEAMRFGLPIVSSNVGGCHEMVTDGENGFLFEPFDEEALISHFKNLNQDRTLRNTLARQSFEMSSRYDLNVTIQQFLDMYRKAGSKQ